MCKPFLTFLPDLERSCSYLHQNNTNCNESSAGLQVIPDQDEHPTTAGRLGPQDQAVFLLHTAQVIPHGQVQ